MMGRSVMLRMSVFRLGLTAVALIAVCLLSPGTVFSQESADLDQSGFVDANDLILFQEQWHVSLAPTNDPDEVAVATIQSVSFPVDNKPVVTFTLVDGNGDAIPIDIGSSKALTRVRFFLARIIEDNLKVKQSHYQNYVFNSEGLPTSVSGSNSNITSLGGGVCQFKYPSALPITAADRGLTNTLCIQITYDLDHDGVTSVQNPIYNFRPDGGTVTTVRELTTTDTCNKCHNPMSGHGTRREYGLCILCHYPGVEGEVEADESPTGTTTTYSVDMAQMIHQIHIVKNFVNKDNSGTAADGINSATPYWSADFGEFTYPQDVRNCNTCHTGSAAHPEMASYNLEVPSRLACGGCHDKIDFANGIGHMAQADDSMCYLCHQPTTDVGTVPSISKAHTVPSKSSEVNEIFGEILSVSGVVAGGTPTIIIKVYQEVGGVTSTFVPGGNNSIAVMMAGPTTDYAFDQRESVTTSNSTLNPDGSRTYKFAKPIWADAAGYTYAFELEARGAAQTIMGESVRPAAINPVVFYEVGSGKADPVPRREVIDWDKCLACHDFLSLHGANRNQYQGCVMCHRPTADDESRRNAENMPPESIDFKYMIHKIHRGTDLEKDYTVFGFRTAPAVNPVNFNEVTFPGDLRDCETCHLPGTYDTIPPTGARATVVTQENPPIAEPIISFQPVSAACVSCHDDDAATQHITSFTTINAGVENCDECHGRYKEWSYEQVHFRGL